MRGLIVGVLVWWPAMATAAVIDFSAWSAGPLQASRLTMGGVQVEAVGGQLVRLNGVYCCDHEDAGLGVLRSWEIPDAATVELNPGEAIVLRRPINTQWRGVWFSSVNGSASAYLWDDETLTHRPVVAGQGVFAGTDTGWVPLTGRATSATELWVLGNAAVWNDNALLVRGVEIVPSPVPEPATLGLLGVGLLGGLRWLRRR